MTNLDYAETPLLNGFRFRKTHMPPKPLKKTVLLAIGLSILFFLTAGNALAECPGDVKPSAEDPMQMLVLGDSIMWGQGLKPEQKFSWRVKCWLQEKTGREVQTRIEAHSGALLAGASSTPLRFNSNDGEVNLPFSYDKRAAR